MRTLTTYCNSCKHFVPLKMEQVFQVLTGHNPRCPNFTFDAERFEEMLKDLVASTDTTKPKTAIDLFTIAVFENQMITDYLIETYGDFIMKQETLALDKLVISLIKGLRSRTSGFVDEKGYIHVWPADMPTDWPNKITGIRGSDSGPFQIRLNGSEEWIDYDPKKHKTLLLPASAFPPSSVTGKATEEGSEVDGNYELTDKRKKVLLHDMKSGEDGPYIEFSYWAEFKRLWRKYVWPRTG